MKENFERVMSFVLKWEGDEFENVVGDKGGPTKFGINSASHPDVDLKTLTREQALEIYRESYWNKIKGDKLPYPLDFVMMDYAVNSGVSRATKILQRLIGVVDDGILGNNTLKNLSVHPKQLEIAKNILTEREAFLRLIVARNPTQAKFLKGWLNRTQDLRKELKLGAA